MKGINIKDRNYELYSVAKDNEVFTMELTKKDLIAALSGKQTIINKAIEYIEQLKTYPYLEKYYVKNLERILKGEDKE